MKRLIVLAVLALAAVPGLAAEKRAPDPDPKETAARLNAQLAVAYLKQNDVAEARKKIEKALQENDKDPAVQSSAGLVYERLLEPAQADRHYSAALRLAPNDADMVNNYAVFQCRRGNWEKGQKLFEQAARSPSYATPEVAYANAGVCARSARDLKRAEDLFGKALAIRPDYPDALLQMADLTLARGAGPLAHVYLQRYLLNGPASPDALLLAVRIARAIADHAEEGRYAAQLQHDFPDSAQTRELRAGSGGE
ncbi:MAG TPA: type IV pilus biogenesis/stability protein PilW [Steroidobacteraceae bacterium]|nr:type IV pilus biogenesis/stability protein PilW [Steroidobacteraceae bacterium]